MKKTTIPNEISAVRILLSPVLLVPGLFDRPRWFLALFAVLLVSDFLDGFLARILHQISRLGTVLDTAGDVLMAFFAIFGGWLLWPEQVEDEAFFFLAVIGLLLLSGVYCFWKHRRLPSYHAWSAKASTSAAGIGAWLLFAGVTPWVFRCSIAVLAWSAIEEMLISALLPEWHPDVPTVFHAVRERRRQAF